jgi:pimeloyl-ACP methyl ester carboxylesterase
MAIDEAQREQVRAAYADENAINWSLDDVLVGSPISKESRRQLIADAKRLSPEARSGRIDVGTREDFAAAVSWIDVPGVMVAGDLGRVDLMAVVKAHLVPHYPSATLKVLLRKGHLLPVESAEEVPATVGEFAASL